MANGRPLIFSKIIDQCPVRYLSGDLLLIDSKHEIAMSWVQAKRNGGSGQTLARGWFSSVREGRPFWGNRVIGVGPFWGSNNRRCPGCVLGSRSGHTRVRFVVRGMSDCSTLAYVVCMYIWLFEKWWQTPIWLNLYLLSILMCSWSKMIYSKQ